MLPDEHVNLAEWAHRHFGHGKSKAFSFDMLSGSKVFSLIIYLELHTDFMREVRQSIAEFVMSTSQVSKIR